MKVEYVSRNKQFKLAFEGNEKELFEQLGHFQEVFENNNTCKCGCTEVSFNMRVAADKYKYYEKVCQKCKARFQYGQLESGDKLFPKYDKGWHHYVPEESEPVKTPKGKK